MRLGGRNGPTGTAAKHGSSPSSSSRHCVALQTLLYSRGHVCWNVPNLCQESISRWLDCSGQALDSFAGDWNQHISSIQVLPRPAARFNDFLKPFQVPQGGMNFSTGAPVNSTAAAKVALAAARQAGGGVVLLPIGKTFVAERWRPRR